MRLEPPTDREWEFVALTGSLLTVASLVPGPEREEPQPPPYQLDKLAHATGHGAFTVALANALAADGRSAPVATAVCVSGLGGLALELLQRRIPGRRFEVGDVASGVLGSLGGVAAVWARRRRPSGRQTTHDRVTE